MDDICGTRTQKEREQYSEWLQTYRWDYFLTATFDPGKGCAIHAKGESQYVMDRVTGQAVRSEYTRGRKEPYSALKAVSGELVKHNVARAFLVAEPHQSGDLHIHGIVAGSVRNGRNLMESPGEIWSALFKRFGGAKVEPVHGAGQVCMYCSKYVLKQQSRTADYYEVYGNKLAWERGKLEVAQC